ncbi:MAG: DNA polymerase III subunit epsilon [Parvularculaceae bacterium]|nr:DNA polymerase III subunit epsilon [Parvularculaceae bacterium]
MRQIVFDIETTGFRFDAGHRIVEIGAVELVRGAVTGRHFHAYIDPERDMPEEARAVHGLSSDFLAGKPVFAAIAPAFVAFAGEAEIIAHNGVAFDMPFVNAELEAAGLPRLRNAVFDTLIAARRKFPGSPASLDALCARFGVDTSARKRDGHGALLDSKLLAAVYIELTGGAQAGLDLASEGSSGTGADGIIRPARPRPAPLADPTTPEESAAHDAFVRTLPNSLWIKKHESAA